MAYTHPDLHLAMYTLSRILDNGDEVLNSETNKELATVASFLATRGVISDVISTSSVIGTIKYYTFPSVQMLHECTFLFKNVNLYFV